MLSQHGKRIYFCISNNKSSSVSHIVFHALFLFNCAKGSKDGKTAWKKRKEALDEVEALLKKCSGLLDTSPTKTKQLVELTKALRERLTDTQINLKPVAARVIGHLLSLVDKSTQAKLGRIIYAPLINAVMTDIKKQMKDAALEALRVGSSASLLEGGGFNEEALEALVSALALEVKESSLKVSHSTTPITFSLINHCFSHSNSINISLEDLLACLFFCSI